MVKLSVGYCVKSPEGKRSKDPLNLVVKFKKNPGETPGKEKKLMPTLKNKTKKIVKNLAIDVTTFDGYINERVLDVDNPELGSREMYEDPYFKDLYYQSLNRLVGQDD
jgi:hypothetical protein